MAPEELKRIRKTVGWTQEELAEFLGVGKATISRYEMKSEKRRVAIHPTIALVMGWIRDRVQLPHVPPFSEPELLGTAPEIYQTDIEDFIRTLDK